MNLLFSINAKASLNMKPIPAFKAGLYKCRRTEETCIKIMNYTGHHFFYGVGGWNSCKKCEDRFVCSQVHGVPEPYTEIVSSKIPFNIQLLLFNERRLTESFTVGRFKFERKVNVPK